MTKSLIIVESPAKTKTLKNFLGKDFQVEASMGHVRDLPKKELGVDVEHEFKPSYTTIPERRDVLKHLKDAASKAEIVYLATDPDREGEAIAWHLEQALKLKDARRITFNEITRNAVQDALAHPHDVNDKLVDAQQARRVLDRLVGYKLSPLLWSKVKKNLSAGRVQSVAVRLICDREREIEAFVPEEYWSLTARLTKQDEERPFNAKLIEKKGEKIKVGSKDESDRILSDLEGATYVVASVKEREQKRNPAAPFITSTLQQEASRKLGFSNKKTMTIAQMLYEGIDLGGEDGHVGLITYMRTDSTRIAQEAVDEAREYILESYGREYLPSAPRQYKSRKSAQEAHEAIRPTSVYRKPEELERILSKDQFRLYKLIWQRFLACQMESAVLNVVTIDIAANEYTFRVTGSTVKFPGFTVLYTEGKDNGSSKDEEDENQVLPKLTKDELLRLLEMIPKQHFTEPPPRYTEATLVKTLEEKGIGRPSTYASIISTIQDREYVVLAEKKFKPTDLGCTVTDLLVKHFPDIMDATFTAGVETKLDDIEEGDLEWQRVISEFWGPFEHELAEAKEKMEKVKKAAIETEEPCPNCGKPLFIRESRYGQFLGCSGYPKCKTVVTKNLGDKCPMPGCGGAIVEETPGSLNYRCSNEECTFVSKGKAEKSAGAGQGESAAAPEVTDQMCPKCGKPLIKRSGKYGEFLGCSGYPKCKTIINIRKEGEGEAAPCPVEGCTGHIVQKFSRMGPFYGCDRYPECKTILPGKPLDRKCPTCGSMLVEKQYRGKPQGVKCTKEGCDYKEAPEAATPEEDQTEAAVS